MEMSIFDQFIILFDPSTALGAFLISIAASFIVGFWGGKNYSNIQIGKNVHGDMNQNSNKTKEK